MEGESALKRPAFQFYPADWRKDAAVQACSMAARGLWHEMLCIMHECQPYGYLTISGAAMSPQQLARLVGEGVKDVSAWLSELEAADVFSRDPEGRIFSRRMVKDERLRVVRAEAGGQGGNPALIGGYNAPGFVYIAQRSMDRAVKIGISVDPAKRIYKLRQQFANQEIVLLAKHHVLDMGAEEEAAHSMFREHRLDSEWFRLDEEGLNRLELHLKAKSKASPTPSSSSSSSENLTNPSGLVVAGGGEPPPDDAPRVTAIPDCEHQRVVDLYHEKLPMCPRVIDWNATRQGYLRQRWREQAANGKWTCAADGVAYFGRYFEFVAQSKFLTGQRPGRGDAPPFVADLEWLLRPTNFAKVREGKYHAA